MPLAQGQYVDTEFGGPAAQGTFTTQWLHMVGALGYRSFWIDSITVVSGSGSLHDYSPGAHLQLTIKQFTGGTTPPGISAANLEVYADDQGNSAGNGAGALATIALNQAAASQVVDLYLSSTPSAAGGTAYAGVWRLNLQANTTGGGGYNVDSDRYRATLGTTLTGFQSNQPILRANPTLTVGLSNSAGGTKPARFAYGDSVWTRTTAGAAPNVTGHYTLSGALGAIQTQTITYSGTTNDLQYGVCDNRFPVSSGSQTFTATVGNAGMLIQGTTTLPWTTTANPTDSATFDPRLSFSYLHQDNDNVWAAGNPNNKDVGQQRLASDLAFLAAHVANMNGVAQNGITWTQKLYDHNQLVWTPAAPYKSVSQTSQAQGGVNGWGSSFLVWDSQLPPGYWDETVTITGPAGATGLETGALAQYLLVASNPNLRIIAAGGPATTAVDARHFTPGDSFLAGVAVINVKTMTLQPLDASPTPSVAIGRFNLSTGRAEFLASDGVTWNAVGSGTVYFHPCTVSPGDSHVFTKTFSNTSGWGNADVFIIGSAYVSGVPVNDFYKEIVVNGINNHDAYKFDGSGFVGFPYR